MPQSYRGPFRWGSCFHIRSLKSVAINPGIQAVGFWFFVLFVFFFFMTELTSRGTLSHVKSKITKNTSDSSKSKGSFAYLTEPNISVFSLHSRKLAYAKVNSCILLVMSPP